jgi:hypothetical protein
MRSGVKKMCAGGGDANPGNLINSCAKVMRLDLEQSRSWPNKKRLWSRRDTSLINVLQ